MLSVGEGREKESQSLWRMDRVIGVRALKGRLRWRVGRNSIKVILSGDESAWGHLHGMARRFCVSVDGL
jgi:hypothetical protein